MEKQGRKPNENIQVYVRIRPANARERGLKSMDMVETPSCREVVLKHISESKLNKKFTFDRAFGQDSRQNEVYGCVVNPMIEEVLSGYNCTVFAYGQTGTGKTYTMIGEEVPELHSAWDDDNRIGVIPRAVNHLFDELRLMEVEFSMRISYLELYNEELFDLLSPEETTKIRIYEDTNKKGSIIVHGLEEIPVHSKHDVYKLLAQGQEKRKTAPTLMNAQSSRSHTIFSIVVHMKDTKAEGEEMLKIGKLNLVDLAGSENISKAGNEKGARARETVNINQSLLTLGRVMTALVEHQPHVPYRESKLTRLLQESLGGRTKTSIIATISPGHKDYEETANTLDYACRAKNIQNRPEVNQRLTKRTVIKEFTEEIDRLKRDLMAARNKDGIFLTEETYNELLMSNDSTTKELNEKAKLIRVLKEQMAAKEQLFTEVSLHLVEKEEELRSVQNNLKMTGDELQQTQEKLHETDKNYKQQKFLVGYQKKTGEQLHGQATQLLSVTETATSDVSQLQETIDRRKGVDQKNQSTANKFCTKMEKQFHNFGENVAHIRVDAMKQNDALQNQIDEKLAAEKNVTTRLQKEFSDILVMYQSSVAENTVLLNKFQDNAKEDLQLVLSVVNQALVKNQEAFANQLKTKLDEICSVVADQREVTSRIDQVSREGTNKVVEISDGCRKEIGDLDAEEGSRWRAMDEELDQMMVVLDNMRQRRKDYQEQLKEVQQRKAQCYSIALDQVKGCSQSTSARIQAEQGAVYKNIDATMALANVMQELTDARQQASEADHAHVTVEVSKTVERVVVTNQELTTQMDANVETVEGLVKEAINHTIEDQDANARFVVEHKEGVTRMHNSIDEFTNQLDGFTKSCTEAIRKFCGKELEVYNSTGLTPARKNFQYPRTLVQASPHERVLERFQYDPNISYSAIDIVTEVDEEVEQKAQTDAVEATRNEDDPPSAKPVQMQFDDSTDDVENQDPNQRNSLIKSNSKMSVDKALEHRKLGETRKQENVYIISDDE